MKRVGIIGSRHFNDQDEFHDLVRDAFRELGLHYEVGTIQKSTTSLVRIGPARRPMVRHAASAWKTATS